MLRALLVSALLIVPALFALGCSASGATPEVRRESIMELHDETLDILYNSRPGTRDAIASAPGYAVFSNVGVQVFLVGGGAGYGVAVDNDTGERTYMKMGEGSVGLGLGVTDFRAVFIFGTEESFRNFVDTGWSVGAEGDLAAKSDEKGGAASGRAQVGDVTIYQLTDSGLAASVSVAGTRYWKDGSLN